MGGACAQRFDDELQVFRVLLKHAICSQYAPRRVKTDSAVRTMICISSQNE
jgi:hypothetical protein